MYFFSVLICCLPVLGYYCVLNYFISVPGDFLNVLLIFRVLNIFFARRAGDHARRVEHVDFHRRSREARCF